MAKKPGFTLEQHKKHGSKINDCYACMVSITTELENAYPKTSPVNRLAKKALKAIEDFRNHIDNMVCDENPSTKDTDLTKIYYGGER